MGRELFFLFNILLYWILCIIMGNMYTSGYCSSNPKCEAYVYGTGCVKDANSSNGSVEVKCQRTGSDDTTISNLDNQFNGAIAVFVFNLVLMVVCGLYYMNNKDYDQWWSEVGLIVITSGIWCSAWFTYCYKFYHECGDDTKCIKDLNTITEKIDCTALTECSSGTKCNGTRNILKVQCKSNVKDDTKEEASTAYKVMIGTTVLWSIIYIGRVFYIFSDEY
mgnify:CR=1 FL=1